MAGKKLSGEPHGVGKPNLFVIGAAKCGATYLHDVLSQHGEIFMSGIKEPRYFTRDDHRELRAWHEELFSENPDKAVIGESSPSYSETTYFVSFPSQWTGHK